VFTPADLLGLQRRADQVFVHNALVDYTVRLVLATRAPAQHGMTDVAQLIQYGASPRASLGIVRATRALALLRGRTTPCRRTCRTSRRTSCGTGSCSATTRSPTTSRRIQIVARIMASVPMPQVAPRQGATRERARADRPAGTHEWRPRGRLRDPTASPDRVPGQQ
jgi:MoxR-like ATPase